MHLSDVASQRIGIIIFIDDAVDKFASKRDDGAVSDYAYDSDKFKHSWFETVRLCVGNALSVNMHIRIQTPMFSACSAGGRL